MNSLYPLTEDTANKSPIKSASTTYGGKALDRTFSLLFEVIKRNKGVVYCHENNVKTKVTVKSIGNQRKATHVSQFELVLHKDGN